MFDSENVAGEGLGSVPCYGPVLPAYVRTVVLNLFSTAPPLSNCPLCQAPLKTKNLCKQMYLSVNLLMKLSMLHSAQGVAPPLKSIDAPLGRRASPVKNHCVRRKRFVSYVRHVTLSFVL